MTVQTKSIRLSKKQREIIYQKTKGHCHVCGCKTGEKWAADHIIPFANGGASSLDNYLPSCYECNRLRWFYEPKVIKEILSLGVYCHKVMTKGTFLGKQIKEFFVRKKEQNDKRRR